MSHCIEVVVFSRAFVSRDLQCDSFCPRHLQSLLERDDSAVLHSPPSPRSADGDSGGGGSGAAAPVQLKPARKQLQVWCGLRALAA